MNSVSNCGISVSPATTATAERRCTGAGGASAIGSVPNRRERRHRRRLEAQKPPRGSRSAPAHGGAPAKSIAMALLTMPTSITILIIAITDILTESAST
jgi:hypothetical protein